MNAISGDVNKNTSTEQSDLQKAIGFHVSGDTESAKKAYQAFIDTNVLNKIPYSNLASIYIRENQPELALACLLKALEIDPEYVDALFNLGITLEKLSLENIDDAIACYQKIIEIEPNSDEAYYFLGNAHMKLNHRDKASVNYKKVIQINPDHAFAYYNLGNIQIMQDQLSDAAQSFSMALSINNILNGALCKYWHMRMRMCEWSDYSAMLKPLHHALRTITTTTDLSNVIAPFTMLNIHDDPALHLKSSKDYLRAKTVGINCSKPLFTDSKKKAASRIKVAFLSADFRDHATTILMAELFELFDQTSFEIHAVSFSRDDNSIMKKRIQTACEYFHDVINKTDEQIAQLIADLDIDIAIDLKGFTSESRPAVLAYRPAPIQVNYLGYPGSMGADYIDYIIADPFVIPEDEQINYSEKIMYLPDSYQVNDRSRTVHPNIPTRESCGLPANGFIYCCFNQSYKFTPEIFDVWMELLKETPGSILWLLESNQWANENLKKEAEFRGVDPSRLVFAEQLLTDQHLARLKNADLFLDTFPCNAHTTASDALWMGLPYVTYSGRSFAARVAGSLLKAVDLEELITTDLIEYKTLALELAHNPEKLAHIKSKLINNRDTCSLFETERYTSNLQRGLKHMMDLHDARSKPETFYVSDMENNDLPESTPNNIPSQENNGLTINVAIIRPQGYIHSDAFHEIAETLFYSFNDIGFNPTITENTLIEDGINIILGANLLEEGDIELIPNSSIIYNFEQITDTSTWMTPAFLDLFKQFEIWDYSKKNIKTLKEKGISEKVHHVPVGYTPNLTRVPKAEVQDIDVLFYGSINDRRRKILEALNEAGLKVETLFGVYGAERDAYISRSKVIINIHYYDSNILEQVRISYLLANKKAIVSECADTTEVDDDLKDAIALVSYDQLVDKCCELVRSEELRSKLEEKGFESIQVRNAVGYINEALMTLSADPVEETQDVLPKKINIGSGKDFIETCLNIDISENSNPDVIVDLSDKKLIGKTVKSKRFGSFTFNNNQFDEIIANDVLEHIPDLVPAMTNCLDLLSIGGQFKINVPYDLSYGAWQDPTHVRAFNERSWLYYTDWFWYLGWKDARFDLTSLDFSLSPTGTKMQQEGKSIEQILTQPRAVDNMSVVLTKRLLTDEEKANGQLRMKGV